MDKSDPLLDALSDGADPGLLWELATGWLTERGFDRVIHVSLGRPGQEPELRTTMPGNFLQTYLDRNFAEDDPFLTYCLSWRHSIATGPDYLGDYGYLSQRAHELIETAGSAGFRAGFSVTTRRTGAAGGEGWNIGSSAGRRHVEASRRYHGREIAYMLHALRGRLQTAWNPLTAREEESMLLLARGLRNRQIARELGIREVTVEFHLANARRKLGASTREASVARFIELRRQGE